MANCGAALIHSRLTDQPACAARSAKDLGVNLCEFSVCNEGRLRPGNRVGQRHEECGGEEFEFLFNKFASGICNSPSMTLN
jgi:hypothetical protein